MGLKDALSTGARLVRVSAPTVKAAAIHLNTAKAVAGVAWSASKIGVTLAGAGIGGYLLLKDKELTPEQLEVIAERPILAKAAEIITNDPRAEIYLDEQNQPPLLYNFSTNEVFISAMIDGKLRVAKVDTKFDEKKGHAVSDRIFDWDIEYSYKYHDPSKGAWVEGSDANYSGFSSNDFNKRIADIAKKRSDSHETTDSRFLELVKGFDATKKPEYVSLGNRHRALAEEYAKIYGTTLSEGDHASVIYALSEMVRSDQLDISTRITLEQSDKFKLFLADTNIKYVTSTTKQSDLVEAALTKNDDQASKSGVGTFGSKILEWCGNNKIMLAVAAVGIFMCRGFIGTGKALALSGGLISAAFFGKAGAEKASDIFNSDLLKNQLDGAAEKSEDGMTLKVIEGLLGQGKDSSGSPEKDTAENSSSASGSKKLLA